MLKFGYEDLEVWNRSVNLAVNIINIVESLDTSRKHYRLLEQIEASSASISNEFGRRERPLFKKGVQYCYIARGSLYETMTLLEIFRKKKWISDPDYFALEKEGKEIASMIKGLINSINKLKA